VSEYDALVGTINKYMPEWNIPTAEELFMKHHIPDWMTFGALSSATKVIPGLENGVYLGSSMNAVGSGDMFSAAMLPFVQAIGAVAGVTSKTIASMLTDQINSPPQSDIYKAGKQLLPGITQPYYEKHFMFPGSNTAPKSSSLEGGYDREPADWNALQFVGRRSLKETRESLINRTISSNEKTINDNVKDLVSAAVDKAMGRGGPNDIGTLKSRAIQLGVTSDDFDQAVKKEMDTQMYSVKTREAGIHTLAGERQRIERQKMMGY
jgi:hypothetical protein